jgi:hypothetical protein
VSGKADFTIDQWDLLRSAPMMSSLLVVAASPSGPLGLIQESAAAGKVVSEAAKTAQTPLLRELSQDLTEKMTIPRSPEGTTPEEMQDAAAAILQRTSALLASKATAEETTEIKVWLLKIGQATAEAAKEGGFLGFGGTLVSEEEKTALDSIHRALYGIGTSCQTSLP